MAVTYYQAEKFSSDSVVSVRDCLTVEESLEIKVNGEPFTMTMRTPGNDIEFIHGFLFTENVYTKIASPLEIKILQKNAEGVVKSMNVTINNSDMQNGMQSKRNFMSVSSCGICGKTELDDLSGNLIDHKKIMANQLKLMFEQMNASQPAFISSGGAHAAAAFSQKGQMLSVMEDIGRHNAVDKVVGQLSLENQLDKATVLTVSGRVSYEIVMKAFRAKIPILAAVSAPSTLAVDFAKKLGVTLLGFCRNGQFTCYANPNRIIINTQNHV